MATAVNPIWVADNRKLVVPTSSVEMQASGSSGDLKHGVGGLSGRGAKDIVNVTEGFVSTQCHPTVGLSFEPIQEGVHSLRLRKNGLASC